MEYSIVTVCFNCKVDMAVTIKSIMEQTSKNFEYIIIDGKSTDGTCDLCLKAKEELEQKGISCTYISEKDSGIYNAMNKAINVAKGRYILFLNAGDSFYSKQTLELLELQAKGISADCIYGDTVNKNGKWWRYDKASEKLIWDHVLPFCHQSSLVLTSTIKNYMFDEKYKICADYDMFFKMFNNGCDFEYIQLPVSIFAYGGISTTVKGYINLRKEVYSIRKRAGYISEDEYNRHIQEINSYKNKIRAHIRCFAEKHFPILLNLNGIRYKNNVHWQTKKPKV